MLDDKKLRIFRGLLLFVVLVFAFWVMYQLSSIFNPLLVALLLTYISDPLIGRLEKVFKHRLVAVVAIYIYLIVLFVFVPVLVMGRLYTESRSLYVPLVGERSTDMNNNQKWDKGEIFTDINHDGKGQPGELFLDLNENKIFDKSEEAHFYKLLNRAEKYSTNLDEGTKKYIEQAVDVDQVVAYLKQNVKNLAAMGGSATKWIFTWVANSIQSVSGFVIFIVLVPLYTFFFLYEWNHMKNAVTRYLPAFYKDRILNIVGQIDRAVSSFFRGRLIICVLKSLIIAIGLWLCGIRFAFFIGLLAGFLSVIPLFGPIIGVIPAFTFVVIDHNSAFMTFIFVVIAFLVAEAIEGIILQPWILGAETGLHPITLIVSFMVFGQILGLFGVLMAVPLMVIAKILGAEFILPMLEEFADSHGSHSPKKSGKPAVTTDSKPASGILRHKTLPK